MDETTTALLKKYLKGECSAEELHTVKQLLDDEENAALLDTLMDELYGVEWDKPELLEGNSPIDEKRVKSQLAERVAEQVSDERKTHRLGSPIRFFKTWKYAAVWAGIILISGLAILQLKKTLTPEQEIAYIQQANHGQLPQAHTLPDSSVVYIGAGATIRYPETYGDKDRQLLLEGQAFFEVTPDKTRPFTVITNEIHTTVLGTSFKIDAFKDQPLIVAVATGKVAVSHVDNQQNETLATLTPGRKITWDSTTKQAIETEVEVYGLEQWAAGELVFDEQPLGIVLAEIGKRYRSTLSITDPTLQKYRVSGTFPSAEPLEQVLKILGRSGKFNYTATGKNAYRIEKESAKEE